LDGATALKYARSRHTTSDFDRAKRQQKLIIAIKDKMLEQ
jgi:anionic cell wall polymer biosynthesis LytR-Cps2A-Psr (LCP) family protein